VGRRSAKHAAGRRGGSPAAPLPVPAGQDWGPLDLANEGIVLLNERGQFVECNAQALRQLNCTSAALAGRDFWELVPREVAGQ